MKIYFIKFQLKIFPFEINNMIAEYLYENYFNDIKNCRKNIFYFKKIKLPSLVKIYIEENINYDNESLNTYLNTCTHIYTHIYTSRTPGYCFPYGM